MNKHILRSKIKSTAIAYLCWFIFGFHFAYLGKWGLQFLYWITFGGLGLWALIELFLIPGRVERYNALLYAAIDDIERQEKRHGLVMMAALNNKTINTDHLTIEEKAKLFDSLNP